MKIRTGLLAVLVLTAALTDPKAQSLDQDVQIQLGGIQLRLGMNQEDVLRRLAVVYEVKHADNMPGNWEVMRKGGPRYHNVGVVFFQSERLVSVNKSWGPEDQTASAFATALLNGVHAIAGEGRTCTVSVQSVGTIGSQTAIQCGRHRLQALAPSDSSTSAAVVETLE